MRFFYILFIIILICLKPIFAEDIRYDKLLTYERVLVRDIEKDGIVIVHKFGVTKIPIEKIPMDIREELGMSIDGVSEYRDAAAKNKQAAERRARLIKANRALLQSAYMRIQNAEVFQIVDGGVLAYIKTSWDGTFRDEPQYKTVRTGSSLSGYQNKKVKTGVKKVKNTKYYSDDLVYISCDNSTFIDGSFFAGDVWVAGRYSYTNTLGARTTIPKLTANPEDIIKR